MSTLISYQSQSGLEANLDGILGSNNAASQQTTEENHPNPSLTYVNYSDLAVRQPRRTLSCLNAQPLPNYISAISMPLEGISNYCINCCIR
jgi:hypothetical protein